MRIVKWLLIAIIILVIAWYAWSWVSPGATSSSYNCQGSDYPEWQNQTTHNWVAAAGVYPGLEESIMPRWYTNSGYRARSSFQTPGVLPTCQGCGAGPANTSFLISGYYPDTMHTFSKDGYETLSNGYVGEEYSKGGLRKEAWNPGPARAYQAAHGSLGKKSYVLDTREMVEGKA